MITVSLTLFTVSLTLLFSNSDLNLSLCAKQSRMPNTCHAHQQPPVNTGGRHCPSVTTQLPRTSFRLLEHGPGLLPTGPFLIPRGRSPGYTHKVQASVSQTTYIFYYRVIFQYFGVWYAILKGNKMHFPNFSNLI